MTGLPSCLPAAARRCLDDMCANRIVGGLLLHLVRKPSRLVEALSGGVNVRSDEADSLCSSTRYSGLVAACVHDASLPDTTANLVDLGPIGNGENGTGGWESGWMDKEREWPPAAR